jgi:hypothetical protein
MNEGVEVNASITCEKTVPDGPLSVSVDQPGPLKAKLDTSAYMEPLSV